MAERCTLSVRLRDVHPPNHRRLVAPALQPPIQVPEILIQPRCVLFVALSVDARLCLPRRFGKYGVSLHPLKTQLIDFRSPRGRGPDAPSDSHERRTFHLLGFTHYWAKSRRGYWVVKRKTAKDRFSRAVERIGQWCRAHRHLPVKEQRDELARKLRGHFEYYGITGNSSMLGGFRQEATRRWHYWVNR